MTQHTSVIKKIVFAAGGTGGHLFPAQALAAMLKEKDAGVAVFFAGTGLEKSAYFERSQFPYEGIASGTPFTKSYTRKFQNVCALLKGIVQSFKLLSRERPELVVGFGSFHAFPVLFAAVLKRIPLILFESNAIPGKVVRLFSRFSLFTAIYFAEAKSHVKAQTFEVAIPSLKQQIMIDKASARAHFNLDPDRFTLLVFGGSQGAQTINQSIMKLIPRLVGAHVKFQIIHLTGNSEVADEINALCETHSIPCHVKSFERQMDLAWSAADVAMCRAGAATLSEMIHFTVPSLLIPYPHAADQHQLKNAQYVEKVSGGVKVFEEGRFTLDALEKEIQMLASPQSAELESRKKSLKEYQSHQNKSDFVALVLESMGK